MTSPIGTRIPQPQYGTDVMDYSDYVPMPEWRP
jgi:phage baseplate assembly protein W